MLARVSKTNCRNRVNMSQLRQVRNMKRTLNNLQSNETTEHEAVDAGSSSPTRSQLESLNHAMINLSKYTNQVLSLCPELGQLTDLKMEKNKDLDHILQQPRMRFARTLKQEYNKGNLPILDFLAKCQDQDAEVAITKPSSFMLNFDPSPHDRRTLASSSSSESRQAKKIKTWPPPLPEIHDRALRKQVFTHKSVANEFHQRLTKRELLSKHNERLEFIGDSVLGFIVSNLIYEWFPDAAEGDLTSMRSMLVCNDTLWEWALLYGLEKQLETRFELTGEVEGKKSKIIADTFEAYVGGVYMDPKGGPKVVKDWLKELLKPLMADMEQQRSSIEPLDREAKQTLYQQIGSHEFNPQYITTHEGDGDVPFTVECRMGDEVIGVGSASNLKNAGLRAAMMALKNVRIVEKYSELRRRHYKKHPPSTEPLSSDMSSVSTSETNSIVPQRPYDASKSTNKGLNNGPKDKLYSLIGSADHKPRYVTVRDGLTGFSSKCMMSVDFMGEGSGTTKKEAEQKAAEVALLNVNLLTKWVSAKRRAQGPM